MEPQTKSWYDYLFKICIIGSSAVGKSSTCLQLVEREIRMQHFQTQNIEYGTKILDFEDLRVKLEIWDIGARMLGDYHLHPECHNSLGVMLMYSITSRESFREVEDWLFKWRGRLHQYAKVLLVGNKADMGQVKAVSSLEGEALAAKYQTAFCQISAKEYVLVEEAFRLLSQQILEDVKRGNITFDYKKYGIKLGSSGIFGLSAQKPRLKRRSNCC